MFKKQLIFIAIVDCMSYCYNDVIVSMYLIVIPSDSNVGSLFKRCFTPVMSVHSSTGPMLGYTLRYALYLMSLVVYSLSVECLKNN